jgi:histidyl-tRNA synthetase
VGHRPLGAQGTVCGGGRYDGLIENWAASPRPASASAWASSAVLTAAAAGMPAAGRAPDAYAVVPDAAALPQAMPVLEPCVPPACRC